MHDESRNDLLKESVLWDRIGKVMQESLNVQLPEIWRREAGRHRCPFSPLLTVVCQICLADIWKRWGFVPDITIGHSIGEVSAAYEAGLYSLEETLLLTHRIGQTAAELDGAMAHGSLPVERLHSIPVTISSRNFFYKNKVHVTLSGTREDISAFLDDNIEFTEMPQPHPWHHPDYTRYAEQLDIPVSRHATQAVFVSGVSGGIESRLGQDHWRKWLTSPIDLIGSMGVVAELCAGNDVDVIEIGFHSVLEQCCSVFDSYRYVSSMYRGEDATAWILSQRKKIEGLR